MQELKDSGRIKKSGDLAFSLLESCSLCPRKCGVNRLKNEKGFCRTGLKARVYSYMAHHGEEPPISGSSGSGTIFFSGCNMACLYCQNFEFSQSQEGREVSDQDLAEIMLKLQESGCHNINLVTPSHILPQILRGLLLAVNSGLNIPLVYNTGGYELPEIIRLLDGIVDVYLTDMRYGDAQNSLKYSGAADYPRYNQASVKEMHRQVGIAEINEPAIIKKGLIIRHLVLPNRISGTEKIMKFIAEEISPEACISLMSQYSPYYKAIRMKELNRRISVKEYRQAQDILRKYGLNNGWSQGLGGLERLAGVNIKPNV